jgi:hypothetical protein
MPVLKQSLVFEHGRQSAQQGAFALTRSTGRRGMGQDAIGQSREWQALQQNGSVPTEPGQEETFAAEEHGLEVAGCLNVVVDAGRECDQTTCVHTKRFTLQRFLDDMAAGVQECHAVAVELLQDETFAAEESRAEFFLKRDADFLSWDCIMLLLHVMFRLEGIRPGRGYLGFFQLRPDLLCQRFGFRLQAVYHCLLPG